MSENLDYLLRNRNFHKKTHIYLTRGILNLKREWQAIKVMAE